MVNILVRVVKLIFNLEDFIFKIDSSTKGRRKFSVFDFGED